MDAVLSYLAIHVYSAGFLFIRADCQPLTWKWFVDKIQAAFVLAGIDASAYNSHSFHIGVATIAAASGVSDFMIKLLGRWSSDTFQLYIHIPQAELASISLLLAASLT